MPVALFATMLAMSALYAPQPLLPALVREFGVSLEEAAALTTVAFVPLALAPLVYGYVLESMAPRRLLQVAVLLLAGSEFLFFFADSFAELIAIRFFQGMLIPAMLTALMTYISRAAAGAEVQRSMAAYIAATIFGGFLGRAVSGAIASAFGWRYSFLVLAVSLLACFVLLHRLPASPPGDLLKPTPRALFEVLAQPFYLKLYFVIFALFLVFAAIMNFIPFRLTEISSAASELRIGLMYSGYIMGIVSALSALRIVTFVGGEIRAMAIALVLYVLALLGLMAAHPAVLFLVMFLFCGAMFLVHATASGLLNRHAAGRKGIVNGLYVAFYYGGGTVGSFLPGFVYRAYGWPLFILLLAAVAIVALLLVLKCRSQLPVRQ